VKPSPLIFGAALELVGCEPGAALMVGDSPRDDIGGARAVGMRALLLDRAGRFPEEPERIESLAELPAMLGL
jgi:putative hydrolase of the HAD superfamily